jgi:hypothetical protein
VKTLSIRAFTRSQGYRAVKEPVTLTSGKEVLGQFTPAEWQQQQHRAVLDQIRKLVDPGVGA